MTRSVRLVHFGALEQAEERLEEARVTFEEVSMIQIASELLPHGF